jgi:hypothetical protein
MFDDELRDVVLTLGNGNRLINLIIGQGADFENLRVRFPFLKGLQSGMIDVIIPALGRADSWISALLCDSLSGQTD